MVAYPRSTNQIDTCNASMGGCPTRYPGTFLPQCPVVQVTGVSATSSSNSPPHADVMASFAVAVESCQTCRLHRHRRHPSVGEGPWDAELVVVTLVPRRPEDLKGAPLAGSARNVVDNALEDAGIDPSLVRFTNFVRCRPPHDRPPSIDEARSCSRHLRTELDLITPRVVVACGDLVASALYGRRVCVSEVAGFRLDMGRNVTLIPTVDPRDVLRGKLRAADGLRRDMATAKAVIDGRLPTGAQIARELRARVT